MTKQAKDSQLYPEAMKCEKAPNPIIRRILLEEMEHQKKKDEERADIERGKIEQSLAGYI